MPPIRVCLQSRSRKRCSVERIRNIGRPYRTGPFHLVNREFVLTGPPLSDELRNRRLEDAISPCGFGQTVVGKRRKTCQAHRSLIQLGAATCLTSNGPPQGSRWSFRDANGLRCRGRRPALTMPAKACLIFLSRQVCVKSWKFARGRLCGRVKDKKHCRKVVCSVRR